MCGSFQQPGDISILEQFERETGVPVSVLQHGESGPQGAAPDAETRQAEGTASAQQSFLPVEGERTLRPFSDVLVIYTPPGGGGLRLTPMYWQLIHDWEKEFRSRYTCFNTRAESLTKKHNEVLLRHNRCILPVDTFFENRQLDGRTLQPREVYDFSRPDHGLMALGGIYSIWQNPADALDWRYSCSIITVPPNPVVGAVHNRMPFIVPSTRVAEWLDPALDDFDTLMKMIVPYAGELDSRRCR